MQIYHVEYLNEFDAKLDDQFVRVLLDWAHEAIVVDHEELLQPFFVFDTFSGSGIN